MFLLENLIQNNKKVDDFLISPTSAIVFLFTTAPQKLIFYRALVLSINLTIKKLVFIKYKIIHLN